MSMPRRAARMMMAALFIRGGIEQLRQPEPLADTAEPVTTPIADRVPQLPNDTTQLVKLDGAVKVVGGVLLVTGPFHRPAALALAGSLVPTTLAGHRFWDESDPAARAQQQINFLKNLGLAGGLLLDALDTGGRPSVPWRARRAARRTADAVGDTRDSVADAAGAVAAAAGALGGAVAHRAGAARGAVAHGGGAARGTVAHGMGAAKGALAHGAGAARGTAAHTAGAARGAAARAQGAATAAKEKAAAAISH
jgi:uncharacterized membrane protein YphA (DoxX/SURF4 family)